MDGIDPTMGQWGLFVSAFVSSTIAPGGSEAVLVYLLSESDISHSSLLVIATVGNTLGALTTWGLGMLAAIGYPVEKYTKRSSNRKAVGKVRHWGVPILLLSWLPVVGDALCFAAGWLRLPFVKSVVMITIGKALRYGAIVYIFA